MGMFDLILYTYIPKSGRWKNSSQTLLVLNKIRAEKVLELACLLSLQLLLEDRRHFF
jgi:hypothetical protein